MAITNLEKWSVSARQICSREATFSLLRCQQSKKSLCITKQQFHLFEYMYIYIMNMGSMCIKRYLLIIYLVYLTLYFWLGRRRWIMGKAISICILVSWYGKKRKRLKILEICSTFLHVHWLFVRLPVSFLDSLYYE